VLSLFDLYRPAVYFLSLHGYIRPRYLGGYGCRVLQTPSSGMHDKGGPCHYNLNTSKVIHCNTPAHCCQPL
jgi:hypothetical protein